MKVVLLLILTWMGWVGYLMKTYAATPNEKSLGTVAVYTSFVLTNLTLLTMLV